MTTYSKYKKAMERVVRREYRGFKINAIPTANSDECEYTCAVTYLDNGHLRLAISSAVKHAKASECLREGARLIQTMAAQKQQDTSVWIPVRCAAAILGRSKISIYKLLRCGKLKGMKRDSAWMIHAESVKKYKREKSV